MNSNLKKRVILSGSGASGKDYARKLLQDAGFSYGISYTTRPMRDGEVNGIDYHFITKEVFNTMFLNGEWYEYVEFNGWIYGTTKEQFKESDDLFIMTPKGISLIDPMDRPESIIIYFDIDESIRRSRLAERQDNNDSIERRLQADSADFKDFEDYDHIITDPNYDMCDLIEIFMNYSEPVLN